MTFRKPEIYDTDIPLRIRQELEKPFDKTPCILTLSAPTGTGKTFSLGRTLGEICTKDSPGIILCPYRASVKTMHQFHGIANESGEMKKINLGYAMRGDTHLRKEQTLQLMTIGYWLEKTLNTFETLKNKQQIIVLDEAHDASWQTDLSLRLLMYLIIIRKYPIKLVITSATIIPIENVNIVKMFEIKEKPKNVRMMFLKKSIKHYEYERVSKILKKFYVKTEGNVLVLLPGSSEIIKFMGFLESDELYEKDSTNVVTLYGSMDKEDITEALIMDPERRTIILATNMVENSITIEDLNLVIDFGKRKQMSISPHGVKFLEVVNFSKNNFIQSSGRTGRQGKEGLALCLYTEREYEALEQNLKNEVYRNPPYRQIIKLVEKNLPFKQILSHVEKEKMNASVKYLISKDMIKFKSKKQKLKKKLVFRDKPSTGRMVNPFELLEDLQEKFSMDESEYEVTDVGKIASQLNTSVRGGSFLATCLITLPKEYFFYAIFITAWIEQQDSLLFFPRKKYGEDRFTFLERKQNANEHHKEFLQKDCLETNFYIWARSWSDEYSSLNSWCRENHLSSKSLYSIENNIKRLIDSVTMIMKYKVEIPYSYMDTYHYFNDFKEKLYKRLYVLNDDRFTTAPVCGLPVLKSLCRMDEKENTGIDGNVLVFGIYKHTHNYKYYLHKFILIDFLGIKEQDYRPPRERF